MFCACAGLLHVLLGARGDDLPGVNLMQIPTCRIAGRWSNRFRTSHHPDARRDSSQQRDSISVQTRRTRSDLDGKARETSTVRHGLLFQGFCEGQSRHAMGALLWSTFGRDARHISQRLRGGLIARRRVPSAAMARSDSPDRVKAEAMTRVSEA